MKTFTDNYSFRYIDKILNKEPFLLTAIAAVPRSASKLRWAASALLKNSSIDVFSVIDIG